MSSENLHAPRERLSQETLNLHFAIVSLMEELDAIDWYRQRADDAEDETLKQLLLHNMREEMEHASMLLEATPSRPRDYPGERLVVCKNPLLAEERARKRAELLAATEKDLARIAARVQRARSPLRGAAAIGQAVGAVLGRRHMAKHFHISITDDTFSFAQNPLSIAAEAALDGIYVVRTNLPAEHSDAPTGQARGLTAHATVRAYKRLSGVEHAFRSLKTVDLELRPVFHWTAPRVRAHVLLCMLAYYLQWHMRQSLAPMLFDDPDPAARDAQRTSPVAKAEPSPAAHRKAARKRTEPTDGEPLPVHSFHTLLADLATLTRNVVRLGRDRLTAILATPTRTQHRALDLLGLTPTA